MKGRTIPQAMWVQRERTLAFFALALLVAALIGVLSARPAHAATFTVNSAADPGTDGCDATECTLREAITAANDNDNEPTVDLINFAIPGAGPHPITPSPELPPITEAVTIDGYSESLDEGASPAKANSLAVGNDAVLKIVLSGTNQQGNGLKIEADNSTVKGLVVSNWDNGIFLGLDTTGNTVEGNFIGAGVSGNATEGNTIGVVASGDGSNIGGRTAAARNIISGNTLNGIFMRFGATGNTVRGNTIYKNGDSGVVILFDNSVDPAPVTGNRILSNSIYKNGDAANGNEVGIDLFFATNPAGVTPNDPPEDDDADGGPNNLQNFPDLTSARNGLRTTAIRGRLNSSANTSFTIQFFSSPQKDPSGFGEGKTFLGQATVMTNEFGNATIVFKTETTVPVGRVVTATATNQTTRDTSEFSNVVTVN